MPFSSVTAILSEPRIARTWDTNPNSDFSAMFGSDLQIREGSNSLKFYSIFFREQFDASNLGYVTNTSVVSNMPMSEFDRVLELIRMGNLSIRCNYETDARPDGKKEIIQCHLWHSTRIPELDEYDDMMDLALINKSSG